MMPGAAETTPPGHPLHGTAPRHKVVALCFLASIICYAARFNLSVCIIAMATEYRWSKASQGWVLSAFFYGYVTTGYLGGMLATRYGGFYTLLGAVVGWSLFTYFTPTFARSSVWWLMACRVGLGVAQGLTFPSLYALVSQWATVEEKTRCITVVVSGSSMGACLVILLAPLVMEYQGWDVLFLGTGYLGLAWALAWWLTVPKDARLLRRHPPSESVSGDPGLASPLLSQGEAAAVRRVGGEVSLRWALSQPPLLALIAGHFAHNWTMYTLLSWLPTYVNEVLGVHASHVGLVFFPYLTMGVTGMLGGWATDELVSRGYTLLTVRKTMAALGMLGPAALLPVFGLMRSLGPAMAMLCVLMGLTSLNQSGPLANHLDIAPHNAGQIQGITNTIASIPGMASVAITGLLLHHFDSWLAVFGVCSLMEVVGVLPFLVYGSTQPLPGLS